MQTAHYQNVVAGFYDNVSLKNSLALLKVEGIIRAEPTTVSHGNWAIGDNHDSQHKSE